MDEKLKFDEKECLVSAIANWAQEHKDRCAIVIVEDEESNIRSCCIGTGKELVSTMASVLDSDGDNGIEDIILMAQKFIIAKRLFKDM